MTRLVSATARVQVTIEVECGSRWGGDCPADQIYKQAQDEARDAVAFALQDAPKRQRMAIVAVAPATVVLTEETRI